MADQGAEHALIGPHADGLDLIGLQVISQHQAAHLVHGRMSQGA